MDAKKIKEHIDYLSEQGFEVNLKFMYTPEADLYDPEKLYSLYYGGHQVVNITKDSYTINWVTIKINSVKKFEKAMKKISKKFKDNIAPFVIKALENLGLEPEHLKYFDRESEAEVYEKFKKEVLRLKNES